MGDPILDVDLLAFERGGATARRAVVDGVRRSLETGFVYTSHDLGEGLIDEAYAMLATFFRLPAETKARFVAPGSHGQTGYTGLLVETAASSEVPDWKEMLNWGRDVPDGHPLKRRFPHRYMEQVLPEAVVPGIAAVLNRFHDALAELQRRFLRVIAVGLGAHEELFDRWLADGPTLTRAIRYPAMAEAPSSTHVWAGAHGDINLTTALPRASAPGLQVQTAEGWVDAIAPEGHAIINTGMMLEHVSNGLIPTGIHRVVAAPGQAGERYSVVQFAHPTPWTILAPLVSCVTPEHPQRFGAIAASDRLDQVLYEINLVEDARRV
jgi:isopenicillin N synthase-like dioxygenase